MGESEKDTTRGETTKPRANVGETEEKRWKSGRRVFEDFGVVDLCSEGGERKKNNDRSFGQHHRKRAKKDTQRKGGD